MGKYWLRVEVCISADVSMDTLNINIIMSVFIVVLNIFAENMFLEQG